MNQVALLEMMDALKSADGRRFDAPDADDDAASPRRGQGCLPVRVPVRVLGRFNVNSSHSEGTETRYYPSNYRMGCIASLTPWIEVAMGTRVKMLTVGLVLATAAMAGCSSGAAGSSGAVQDDAVAAATADAPLAGATQGPSCASGGVCQVGSTGPGGGIVFYVASAPFNAPGTACGATCQYLEAQTSDLAKAPWCMGPAQESVGFSIDAPGTAIGTGYLNTQAMLGTDNNPPAQICTSGAANEAVAPSGGYTDWYLPSKDELSTLLAQSNVVNGFSSTTYWSSTQSSPNYAWCYKLGNMGGFFSDQETGPLGVRAIRAF